MIQEQPKQARYENRGGPGRDDQDRLVASGEIIEAYQKPRDPGLVLVEEDPQRYRCLTKFFDGTSLHQAGDEIWFIGRASPEILEPIGDGQGAGHWLEKPRFMNVPGAESLPLAKRAETAATLAGIAANKK
jgi:hypothetical protein